MTRHIRRSAVVAAVVIQLAFSAASGQSQPAQTDLLAGLAWAPGEGGTPTITFTVDDPDAVAGLLMVPGAGRNPPALHINGKSVAGPLRGMNYTSLQLDPKTYLVKGPNKLTAHGGRGAPAISRLLVIPPAQAAVQSGPILGAIGPDYFSLTCRTNTAGPVTVTAAPTAPAGLPEASAVSGRGYFHRLRVPLPAGTKEFTYTLTLETGKKLPGPGPVRVPAVAGPLRFAVAGDHRTQPQAWASVAGAILKARPDLLVLTGDYVHFGHTDHAWDREFFAPGRDLLAAVPTYGILGNHDEASPVFFEMFYAPVKDGRAGQWAQQVGDVLLVGADTANKNAGAFLEPILKDSKAKFIFVLGHYGAWSSGKHGRDLQSRVSRGVVMPLLVKYRATAMICSHDHDYERSEPPPEIGVPCIISGGGGAPTRPIDGESAAQNPHSKKFVEAFHFCLFEVSGDTCRMKAIDPAGKVIDETAFKARKRE